MNACLEICLHAVGITLFMDLVVAGVTSAGTGGAGGTGRVKKASIDQIGHPSPMCRIASPTSNL
jgi:hypothetical protein